MRGLHTPVREMRRSVFREVARVAFTATPENLGSELEAIPYRLVDESMENYPEQVYRIRAVVSEQVRLAMGLSLRPEDKPVHLTAGVEESNIDQKYYEPPLMQVIPSACDACEDNVYEVSNQCRGCVAKACVAACPKDAISIVDGKSVIDREKCIRCGKCRDVCPVGVIETYESTCHRMNRHPVDQSDVGTEA